MSDWLKVEHVTKSYDGKVNVLADLSFAAAKGEFIVLVGPSGCGKSTMLRSIAGLEEVGSGHIHIAGREVTHLAPKDRQVAMVFQDYALYPHKNVFENIAFGLRIRKVPDTEIKRRVEEAAAKLDLSHLLDRRPRALSGGQRQRVAIGRAIVRKPDLFLFDEPLSNLDAKLRAEMRLTIGRLHQELQATCVYVTHDQTEAMTLADRIIVLEGGKIQQMGRPMELYQRPANLFVATFIGAPAMNTILGHIRLEPEGGMSFVSRHGLEIPMNTSPDHKHQLKGFLARSPEAQEVILGVRPENVRVVGSDDLKGVKAHIIVSEPLGSETMVLADIGGHELQLRVSEPHVPRAGDDIYLVFHLPHLYLFDKASKESLLDPMVAIAQGQELMPPASLYETSSGSGNRATSSIR